MASISKRPDGNWRARYRDPDGKEHAKHCATRAAAQRWLDDQIASIVTGTYVDPKHGKTTFGAWEKHVAAISVNRRTTTQARDASLMRTRVLPTFESRTLTTITVTDVKAWVGRLVADGLAPSTVRKCYQLLSRVMAEAVDAGIIAASPCRRVTLPNMERTKPAVLLAPDEVLALAEAIDARYRALVLCAAYTGLRWGELAGLKVERIDFLRRRIEIAEVLIEVNGTLSFGPPKTTASRATLSLPVPVVELLAAQVANYPDPEPGRGLVFTSDEGTPLRRSNFRRRVWQPAVLVAGLPARATFHDLRHATASWLIHAGANPLEVAAKLRHAKVGTTLSVYGHLFPGTDERLDGLLESTFADAGAEISRTNRGLTSS